MNDKKDNCFENIIYSGLYEFQHVKNKIQDNKINIQDVKIMNVCQIVDTFKRRKEFNDEKCPICISDFSNDLTVVELPCGHLIHELCVLEYFLADNIKCPVCRKDLD